MKKLVKSAKQQFNERITNYCSYYEDDLGHQYYLCGEGNNNKSTIYRCHEDKNEYEYREYIIKDKFDNAINTSYIPFILNIVCNNPFFKLWHIDIERIYNSDCHDANGSFEDIYAEIPDFISAKEQWEKDSADAVVCYDGLEGVCKFIMDADNITFFLHSNGENEEYLKYQSVKMSELRKDGEFIAKYFHEVNILHPQDIESAAKWIATGEYTMSDCSFMDVFNALPESTHVIQYKDKSSSPISLTTEQQEALDMIEKAISLFHERGGKLVCYSYDGDWFVVNCNGVTYESTNTQKDYENLIKDGFIDVSEMAEKQPAKIPLDIYWLTDGSLLAKPE